MGGCLRLVGFVALVIVGLVVALTLAGSGRSGGLSGARSADEFDAVVNCEVAVRQRLKAPSTASFAPAREARQGTTRVGDNAYRVVSWVDAQNSFGAMIRTPYSCLIRFPGNGTYIIDALTFDNP